ncbi:E3 ubiquitin ISG15 ligase trim25 [Mactra antiquata]
MACASISQEGNRYCTPCKSEEVNQHSDIYCMDCEAFFCQDCFKFHMKVPTLAKHTILKNEDINIWKDIPYKCNKHGQRFDYYCVEHSELCCQVCVSLQHRQCEKLEYIPEVCQKQKLETNELREKTNESLKGMDFEERTLKEKVELNDKSKADSECKVTDFRHKMTTLLDKLETHARVAIEERYLSNKKSLEDMELYVKRMKDYLIGLEKRLTSEISDKQNLAYISHKLGIKRVTELEQTLSSIKMSLPEMRYKFAVDTSLEKYVKQVDTIGRIEANTYRNVLLSSESIDTGETVNTGSGIKPKRNCRK